VLLRPSVRRAVVVRQVEVGDPPVEGPVQDRPLGLLVSVVAEVLPETERQRWQLQTAAAREAVVGVVVAVRGCLVAHAPILPCPAGSAVDAFRPPAAWCNG